MGQYECTKQRGSFWGYLAKTQVDHRFLFERLHALFGVPYRTDELVIFFKYASDIRIRLTRDGADFLLKNHEDNNDLNNSSSINLKANICLTEAESFIRLLDAIGYKEGLFSFSTKYTYTGRLGTFIIRLNPRFGDFFQFFVSEAIKHEDAQNNINILMTTLGLSAWSMSEYEDHLNKIWTGVKQERLVDNDKQLHPNISNIIVKYQYAPSQNSYYAGEILRNAILRISNDYSELEDFYKRATQSDLVTTTSFPYSNAFQVTGSIIIPVYDTAYDTIDHTLESICLQDLTPKQLSSFEVIIVDDGSITVGLDKVVKTMSEKLRQYNIKFHMIRSYSNHGRATARNLGASIAKGDILFFIDADVILSKTYLKDAMIRHQYLDNIVLVGLKQNLSLNDPVVRDKSVYGLHPNIEKDIRFRRTFCKNWIGLYPVVDEITVQCINDTNYFKDFGMGRRVGPFDLACMVISHNVSLRRRHFEQCGGFEQHLSTKWGLEDTFLGVNMIIQGNYIIPLMSAGIFHLEPINEVDSGERQRKHEQMADNFKVYSSLMNRTFNNKTNTFTDE